MAAATASQFCLNFQSSSVLDSDAEPRRTAGCGSRDASDGSFLESFAANLSASKLKSLPRPPDSNSTWELPDDYRSGLFGGANPLWQGLDGVFGHLQVPPTEIGVHRLGFRVERLVNSTGFSRLVLVGAGAALQPGVGHWRPEPAGGSLGSESAFRLTCSNPSHCGGSQDS
jgi:hypothetical protein